MINTINWKELVYYDETSPTFLRWKTAILSGKGYNIPSTTIGAIAGSVGGNYSTVSYKDRLYKCHRVVWILHNNSITDSLHIDHIDGNRFNNNIGNLRLVTNKTNQQNQKMNSRNTSGVAGVSFQNGISWVASWFDSENIRHRKTFSISKYGFDNAFNLACEYRIKMIDWLNSNGCNYTERHGK